MLKKIATLAAALVAVLAISATTASAVVPGLEIAQIGYNAYGADAAANRNSEYVDIKNAGPGAVDVSGLLVQDAWARGNNRTERCNTFKLAAGALPIAPGADANMLPAGATLRVHMGSGTASVRGTLHRVYRDMPTQCGYNGHVLNNGASSNKFAPWDTVWITLGGVSESKGYNFSFGYVAK